MWPGVHRHPVRLTARARRESRLAAYDNAMGSFTALPVGAWEDELADEIEDKVVRAAVGWEISRIRAG